MVTQLEFNWWNDPDSSIKDYSLTFFELLNGQYDLSIPHKSSKNSVQIRQAGNKLYASKNHDKIIHLEILSLYTKSIAFAEENSEELALGYGNRSALLMHLKKYKECLIDIERAYEITKSDELKKKLITRKQDCLLKLNKVEEDEQKPPTFNFNPSKEIPCASELLRVEYNEIYGRHVVATQDIQPGTVIVIEKGIVFFPNAKMLYINCSHCLLEALTAIPCPSCTAAIYCSEKCKEEAWQQYHDIECSILPYFDFIANDYEDCAGFTNALSITTRLFIKIIKTEGLLNIIKAADTIDHNKDNQLLLFECNKFHSIYNLSHNKKLFLFNKFFFTNIYGFLFERSKIFYEIVDIANSILRDQNISLCTLEIFKKLGHIVLNNYYSFESSHLELDELSNFGTVICPFSSLFNHSCVPNVKRIFTKNQEILLFTSNFVCKGEQLFINYGTTNSMSKEERQDHLLNSYQFVCNCQACKENWPCLNAVQKAFNKQDTINLQSFIREFEKTRVLITCKNIIKGVNECSLTYDSIEDTAKIINLIYKRFSSRKAYGLAYIFVDFIIYFYNHFYSIRHNIPVDC